MDPSLDLARAGRRPARVDVVVTVGLLFWALLDAVLYPDVAPLPWRVLAAVLWTVPLMLVRRSPAGVTAVVVGTLLLWSLATSGANEGFAPFPSLLVLAFAAGLRVRSLPASAALGAAPLVAMALVVQRGYYQHEPTPGSLVILTFFLGGSWALGRLVLARARQLEQEQRTSGERARTAVVEERARIARELHDVVAHSLSIIAVQAGAAEGLLRKDPERAAAHLQVARTSAREGLAEMRRLVGTLREDDASLAPQPTLNRVDELVDAAREAGTPVELALPDGLPVLPPGLDLTAYRIVQEALTNARKHAPSAPVRVELRQVDGELVVDVRNDTAGAAAPNPWSDGRGLLGMRERVRLFDGELHAGPDGDGCWGVRARLPVSPS